jgi:Zn-finger nucleic acid-binding protein
MLDLAAETPRDCPACGVAMVPRRLHGHVGRPVLVDHCAACRLVWFDRLESVQLSGLGWVELLREFARDEGFEPAPPRGQTLACPECRAALKVVHNRSRWGRFPMLECPQRHGHLNSDAAVLAERGLVRPLLPPERAAIRAQQRTLHCLSCGAAAEFDDALGRAPGSDHCRFCDSPLLVFDLPRLARALRQRGVGEDAVPAAERLSAEAGTPLRWPCRACGAPLDPSRTAACGQCGAGVIAQSLDDLKPLLDAVEPGLRAAVNHPPRPRRRSAPERSWRDTTVARLLRWFWRD